MLGRPVKLVLVDGETKPKVIAREAARLFKQEPALAGLIGFSDTDMVLAAAPIAAKNKRVFLTSGATSPKLPREVARYLFLACFGDNVQAAAGAEWAVKTLKARSAVVLYKQRHPTRACCTAISRLASSSSAARCWRCGPTRPPRSRRR